MRYLVASFCTFILVCVCSLKLQAAEFTDLFQAQVPAQANQSQWQRAALSNVLVKLTGSDAVLSLPAIVDELKNSASYVKQFQTMQINAQSMILVHLDEQKITALLQRQQIPMLGSRRPDQLMWFSEKMQDTPQFVMSLEHPVRKVLQEQATLLGLSLIFPFYDVDDLALLNEQTLWSGEWTAIQAASSRYKASHVHNLMFDQFTDASGTVTFRLTAQQWQNGQLVSREFMNVDAKQLAVEFTRQLAAELASQYAIKISNNPANGTVLNLTIDAVADMTDLVKVQQIFASMLTVKSHSLKEFQQGRAVFILELAASEDEFYRSMQLVSQLRAESQLQPPATAEQLALEAQLEAQFESGEAEPLASVDGLPAQANSLGANAQDLTSPTNEEITNNALEQAAVGAEPVVTAQNSGVPVSTELSSAESTASEPTTSEQNDVVPLSTMPDQLIKTNHFTFVGH